VRIRNWSGERKLNESDSLLLWSVEAVGKGENLIKRQKSVNRNHGTSRKSISSVGSQVDDTPKSLSLQDRRLGMGGAITAPHSKGDITYSSRIVRGSHRGGMSPPLQSLGPEGYENDELGGVRLWA